MIQQGVTINFYLLPLSNYLKKFLEYYFNKENILRGNKGYYSPDVSNSKTSNAYLHNFQKLMGARSASKNYFISDIHSKSQKSAENSQSPVHYRPDQSNSFRNTDHHKIIELQGQHKIKQNYIYSSPLNPSEKTTNLSYNYPSTVTNRSMNVLQNENKRVLGSLHNSPLRSDVRQDHAYHLSNQKNLEYAQQITEIAQMRQLGRYDSSKYQLLDIQNQNKASGPISQSKHSSIKIQKSPSQYKEEEETKYKSPKTKSPNEKQFSKKSSSSKKIENKMIEAKRSVLRKGSLGIIEKFQSSKHAGSLASEFNLGQLNRKHLEDELRNRSYNLPKKGQNDIKHRDDKLISPNRNILTNFKSDNKSTNNISNYGVLNGQISLENTSKLTKQKLKLKNVLQSNLQKFSPQRIDPQQTDNVLKQKWSKSRENTHDSRSISKSIIDQIKRTPRVSKKAENHSNTQFNDGQDSLLRNMVSNGGTQLLNNMIARKLSSGSSLGSGINLLQNNYSKQASSRNSSSQQTKDSIQQEFSSGLKLHTRKKSDWDSRKALNNSTNSKNSAKEISQTSSPTEYPNNYNLQLMRRKLSSYPINEKSLGLNSPNSHNIKSTTFEQVLSQRSD